MADIAWPPPNVAVRAVRNGVTMIVQWCADEQGYIGMAFHDGVPVLPHPIGPCDSVLEADVVTQAVLYRRGLWR